MHDDVGDLTNYLQITNHSFSFTCCAAATETKCISAKPCPARYSHRSEFRPFLNSFHIISVGPESIRLPNRLTVKFVSLRFSIGCSFTGQTELHTRSLITFTHYTANNSTSGSIGSCHKIHFHYLKLNWIELKLSKQSDRLNETTDTRFQDQSNVVRGFRLIKSDEWFVFGSRQLSCCGCWWQLYRLSFDQHSNCHCRALLGLLSSPCDRGKFCLFFVADWMNDFSSGRNVNFVFFFIIIYRNS